MNPMNQNDLTSIVLPAQTTFVLPRNIAKAVLLVGEKVTKFDPAQGEFVRNEPSASAIASALFDGDVARANAFLDAFIVDYNAYVQAGLQDTNRASLYIVP
jgi:hypothetical protein